MLTSAISEVFLRRLAKQGYINYIEGSDIVDTREDLVEAGDPDGGGLKEMDEKLKTYVINQPSYSCDDATLCYTSNAAYLPRACVTPDVSKI